MAQYVFREQHDVTAYQAERDGVTYTTNSGLVPHKAGDYLCMDRQGNTFILPPNRFEAIYRPMKGEKDVSSHHVNRNIRLVDRAVVDASG